MPPPYPISTDQPLGLALEAVAHITRLFAAKRLGRPRTATSVGEPARARKLRAKLRQSAGLKRLPSLPIHRRTFSAAAAAKEPPALTHEFALEPWKLLHVSIPRARG